MYEKTINIKVAGVSYNISIKHRSVSDDLIIFLHGLGCSKDSFEGAWNHKDLTGQSLLSFDLLGFGQSEKPDEFTYTLEDHAGVCDAIIRTFSEDRLHIVAHSMGGAVGLLISDEILNRVISFVNVEGNLISEDCGLISRKTTCVPYKIFKNELFPDFQSQFAGKEYRQFSIDTASPLAFYNSSKSLVSWSESGHLLKRFKGLKCKKIYFYGEQSSGMKVLTKLGNMEKRKISGSGHFLMNDNPDEFYSELRGFLPLSR